MKYNARAIKIAALLCGAAMPGATAAAPAEQPPPNQPTQQAQTPQLEQIIVTAKKRQQNVQTVPQTIDVVGGATLQRLNVHQFQDVQLLVSGLTLNDNGGQGQNISLRGITYDPDTAANPAVDLYLNEVPLSQTSSAFQDLYDLDSVEVIRGPQGTLRGRTSPAGAILIDTARPSMDQWTGYAETTIADHGQEQVEFGAGGPIIQDKLAVRLAGLFDQNDLYGTRDIITNQSDYNLQHSFRITVEMKPTDALNIVVTQQESNDRTREFFGVSGNGIDGPISPSQNLSVAPGPFTFYDRTGVTTVQATYKFDASELTYVGGYQAVKDEFAQTQDKGDLLAGFDEGTQLLDEGLEQLTQEMRFQSSGEQRFGYMLGLYYAHQDAAVSLFTPSEVIFAPDQQSSYGAKPLAVINADVDIPQIATDYAIFTDETFKLTPDDVLEGGVRWQFERQYRANNYTAIIPPVFGGGTISQSLVSPENQKEEYRAWTGLASYTHHFSSSTMLYASYGESFRPGGAVLGNSLPLPESFLLFRPESSYDFEIGGKTQLFDGRVRLNADIFHQAFSGFIGHEQELFTDLGYANVTTNGNAIARGAEFSADAYLTDAWRLHLNTTYTDSHYDNAALPCNDFADTGQPNTNGPPRVFPPGAVSSTCVTNVNLGTPAWFLSLNTEYDVSLTQRLGGFARAVYSFTPATHLGLQDVNIDPRNIANLYFGVRPQQGRWEAAFFVKNLFNVVGYENLFGEQYDSGYLLPTVKAVNYDTGYASSIIQRPRQIGVTFTYRF
jgi:iron complex outermembrane receptor protein